MNAIKTAPLALALMALGGVARAGEVTAVPVCNRCARRRVTTHLRGSISL